MSAFYRHRFLLLLLSLFLLFVVQPLVIGLELAQVLYDGLLTIVFATALFAVFRERHLLILALVLGLPSIVGRWTGYVLPALPRLPTLVTAHILAALFLAFSIAVILRSTYRETTVSTDAVCGALCGYLLIGLAFAHIYSGVEAAHPGSLRGDNALSVSVLNEGQRQALLIYYSFITLTTVGFGDLTPATPLTRVLSWVEAVFGQFYIAVIMAELIGIRVAQALGERQRRQPQDQSGHGE